jgi:hypothetical protein
MVCATRFNLDLFLASAVPVLDPASKGAAAIDSPFVVVVLICVAILIVVALMCTLLVRSRASGDQPPRREFGRRRSEMVVTGPFFNGANPDRSTVYYTLHVTPKGTGKHITSEEVGIDTATETRTPANKSSTAASIGPPRPRNESPCPP